MPETTSATKPWTDYPIDELELQFNPRATNRDSESYTAARAPLNNAGLAWPGRKTDIAYGPGPLMNLDIYPPGIASQPSPVHIFIHGGFWRSREKEDFAWIGASLAANGLMAIILNYPLCPAVKLDDVVAANRLAFEWTCKNIADHGGDPDRITLSGHSAGGHLGAAIIAQDWSDHGLPERPLKGAVLVSGIYDPAPAQYISINDQIGITPEIAERYNFAILPPRLACPVHVIPGGGEPEGWIAQSTDYAAHIKAAGLPVTYTVSGSENHYTIQDQYCDPGSDVLSAILAMA